jgi:histidinol-phosphatase (PHP family)
VLRGSGPTSLASFDVLLGSVHWIGAWLFDAYDDPAFAREWERRAVDSVWDEYADALSELACSGMIDVLAHVDVVKVAGRRPRSVDAFETRLVEAIAASGVVVEVSSAGLRKPARELYPSPSLLARLHAAGVSFTTASDAHRVEQIGAAFEEVGAALEFEGVREVATFSARRRVPVALAR